MTDEMMNLRALIEKNPDADLFAPDDWTCGPAPNGAEVECDRGGLRREGYPYLWIDATYVKLVGNAAPPSLGSLSIILRERGRDKGGDDTSAVATDLRPGRAHEVDASALLWPKLPKLSGSSMRPRPTHSPT